MFTENQKTEQVHLCSWKAWFTTKKS